MSRSMAWRRVCSEEVTSRTNEALQTTLYILNEIGPTGFIVRQDGCEKKFKVFLGDPHSCTCLQFRKSKELCIHILWLILKKFRVPRDNPVVFQLGLVEREIQEVLSGRLKVQSPSKKKEGVPQDACCEQKPVSIEDVCPICQESLTERIQRLVHCKYGCGNNVHLRCIKMWAEHQRAQGETLITCPLCREKFSTFEELYQELHCKPQRSSKLVNKDVVHLGVTCDCCSVCPVVGKCFKCDVCTDCYLCSNCFKANEHREHNFLFRQHPSHMWRSAPSRSASSSNGSSSHTLPSQDLIEELQQRELTENDYELLLHLDAPPPTMDEGSDHHGSTRLIPRRILNSFHTEPLDNDHKLIKLGRRCGVCLELYKRGDWVRKLLPCKHQFHRDCIDRRLSCDLTGNMICPIDGNIVHTPSEHIRLLNTNCNQRSGGPSFSTATRGQGSMDRRDGISSESQSQQELCMSVTGRGLDSGRRSLTDGSVITEFVSLSTKSHPPSGNIRKGRVIPRHVKMNGVHVHLPLDLSLQATPISAGSNASPGYFRNYSELSSDSVDRSRWHNSTSSLLVGTNKRKKGYTGRLPRINAAVTTSRQSQPVAQKEFLNLLSISTAGIHHPTRLQAALDDNGQQLPPIDAHLTQLQQQQQKKDL